LFEAPPFWLPQYSEAMPTPSRAAHKVKILFYKQKGGLAVLWHDAYER